MPTALRTRVNLARLALTATPMEPMHACCPQVGYTCYMNLDGVIISVPDVRPC